MQPHYQIATAHDYKCFITKDDKRIGWFFKPPHTHFSCLHRLPMERPDGLFQLQCLHLEENCGAKIFEGSTSVLALCTPTEIDSVQGSERVVLGIVPIIFCNKNHNLHITLSSAQGKLMMKCQDSTCPVIEGSVDCTSCLIAPENLCNVLTKVYSLRDKVARQQYLINLLDFVRQKTFAQLQDSKLEYPLPKFQKMDDLLSMMSGIKSEEDAAFDNISILSKKKLAKAIETAPVKKSKTSSTKNGAIQKKKLKTTKSKPVDLTDSPNISEDDGIQEATSEEEEME